MILAPTPTVSLSPGFRLGIDLGGTKTEAALVECMADGSIDVCVRRRVPTPRHAGYEGVIANTIELIEQVAADSGSKIEALPIGVGMPGGIRRRDGSVKNSNTTCLNGRPFRADVQRHLGRSVQFDNDANCFALAESWLGAAREWRQGLVFGVIMGTGVGGGLVVQGRVWSGLQGIAGEWGHHGVYANPLAGNSCCSQELRPCYCGKTGCLETYASGPAVESQYRSLTGHDLRLRDIAARATEDAVAALCIDQLLDAFARGIATVINVVDPSVVVLGGGVSNLDILYQAGVGRIRNYVFNDELLTPIVRNGLGDSAGVLGAALLGLDTGFRGQKP